MITWRLQKVNIFEGGYWIGGWIPAKNRFVPIFHRPQLIDWASLAPLLAPPYSTLLYTSLERMFVSPSRPSTSTQPIIYSSSLLFSLSNYSFLAYKIKSNQVLTTFKRPRKLHHYIRNQTVESIQCVWGCIGKKIRFAMIINKKLYLLVYCYNQYRYILIFQNQANYCF